MRSLPWVETDKNTLVLEIPNGHVSIKRKPKNYHLQLETTNGIIVYETHGDLEYCQEWAWYNLPLLDQVEGEFSECGSIGETLDLCQQLLMQENELFHWQRLEKVKSWGARFTETNYEVTNIVLPNFAPVTFDWIEAGSVFHVDTPHGRAIITESRLKNIIGGGIRHQAQIVHHTGAVLDCYSWTDFMEAEYAIKRRLSELLNTDVDEAYLDYFDFTCDICERLLAKQSNPIHEPRLTSLNLRIHELLD